MDSVLQRVRDRRQADEAAEVERQIEFRNRVENYLPPEVALGEDVFWYEGGNDGRTPLPGKIIGVRGKVVDLVIFSSREAIKSVRHIRDPALANKNLCENGAWDFTDVYLRQQAWREEIVQQLDAIKARLDGVDAAGRNKKSQ